MPLWFKLHGQHDNQAVEMRFFTDVTKVASWYALSISELRFNDLPVPVTQCGRLLSSFQDLRTLLTSNKCKRNGESKDRAIVVKGFPEGEHAKCRVKVSVCWDGMHDWYVDDFRLDEQGRLNIRHVEKRCGARIAAVLVCDEDMDTKTLTLDDMPAVYPWAHTPPGKRVLLLARKCRPTKVSICIGKQWEYHDKRWQLDEYGVLDIYD